MHIRVFLAGALAASAFSSASASGFSFGPPDRVFVVRDTIRSVGIGDVNGDGQTDIAAIADAYHLDHDLLVFLQRPDGSHVEAAWLALPQTTMTGLPLELVDLDGDGVDEVVTGGASLTVARFEGGDLRRVSERAIKFGCAYMESGDIDADGHVDVVCHSGLGTPTSATISLGDGVGGFRSFAEMQTGVGSYGAIPDFKSIRLADATGDGRVDLLVTASRVDRFFVYPNDGAGGFSPNGTAYPHPASPSGVWPAAIEVLDVDGDDVNEVVTATPDNQPDGRLNVYQLAPDGRLALSARYPIDDSATALQAADLDGDGDTELVAGHFALHEVTVFGANTPGIRTQERYELPGFGSDIDAVRDYGQSKSFTLGDVDGDGCVDLTGAVYAGPTILHGCKPAQRSLPVSDFDGDGVGDLLWDYFGEHKLWQSADIAAWYVCAPPCPRYKVRPWQADATGDFNGDGNSDVFWRNHETGENSVMLTALFDRPVTGVSDQAWQVVGTGDFDGDDRSDLLWRNASNGENSIWRSANHSTRMAIRRVRDLLWQVAGVGDFDGDGRSDILWRHASTGANVVWRSGNAATPLPMAGVSNLDWEIQGIGDFNGDGEDDIFWRHAIAGYDVIWESADYRLSPPVAGVAKPEWDVVAVADYNADGHSDLMWRNSLDGWNVIWLSARYTTVKPVRATEPGHTLVN